MMTLPVILLMALESSMLRAMTRPGRSKGERFSGEPRMSGSK